MSSHVIRARASSGLQRMELVFGRVPLNVKDSSDH